MDKRFSELPLVGFDLISLQIFPGRLVRMYLLGVAHSKGTRAIEEYVLQFNRVETSNVNLSSAGVSPLRELKASNAVEPGGIREYEVYFDSGVIRIVAVDWVCSLVRRESE